ncbi:hypothetical protein [Vallitalea sp.]|uniref:hypothetical protein n=1 Tax=Vallitalea sp. TaxID=1882829 RepID=UPI0025E0D697|nr:hypothetical protein [Vallitalea sp.]MCT4686115.1 hypothetical protein [Vallitalea sp.]
MNRLKIYLSVVLSMILLFIFNYDSTAETTSNVIYIHTAEDLQKLSENCRLDTFSENIIVTLTGDIDLSSISFEPISSFSGIFEGSNYTISGLNAYDSGSNQGLFRYLQEDGIIKNLTVKGNIRPSGTKKEIGGIVGTNRGQIINCSFNGTVKGSTSIGGIAGYNDKSGKIASCKSYGLIIGEHYIGGVVGQNVGYISECVNNSKVNTTNDGKVQNKDMASYNIKDMNIEQLNSTENIDALTDTGGVVGYNQGIVELSENRGAIGYHHVGYNIGGIIGRQSGYVSDCNNYGIVKGRKDIGGVIGQAEPSIRLLFSEDTLEQIDNELGTLNKQVNQLINDSEKSSQTISSRLDNLNNLTSSASNKMHDLANYTTNYIDDSTAVANTGIDRIRHTMDQLEPILDSFVNASEELTKGFDEFRKGFDQLAKSSKDINNSLKDVADAFDDLHLAHNNANTALDNITAATKIIQKATENSDDMEKAMKKLKNGLSDLDDATQAGIKALEKIADALKEVDNPLSTDWDKISQDIQVNLKTMKEKYSSANTKITFALDVFYKEYTDDQALIRQAFTYFNFAIKDLKDLSTNMNDALIDMEYALEDLDLATDAITESMEYISKGMKYFTNCSTECTNAMTDIKSIVEEINDYEKLHIPKLKDYVTETSDSLFHEIDSISEELSILNEEVKGSSDSFHKNIRAVNKQFEVIVDIIRDGLNSLSFDNKDLFEDISDQSPEEESIKEKGVVKECYNEGDVLGDVNIGGIIGSMAIEYDFDPEDDIINKGNTSFNFKYQTKALLMSSINKGNIQSKKNYAGGIIGRMDLGLLIKSENYGFIESLDGNYTGGIVGSSSSVIRQCYSLSELSGRDYVGGIAGYATDIYNCFSLVKVNKSNEFTGAIAGDISGKMLNNYFVKGNIEGVDSISYGEKAIPQSYGEFILNEELPESFQSFKLTFVVDDEIVKEIPFEYGDSLDDNKLPAIPKKEGYYSNWPSCNYNNLTFSKKLVAIYTPMIQVLPSDSNNPHPKLLVEGAFDLDDTLKIEQVESPTKMIATHKIIEEWCVQLSKVSNESYTYRIKKPKTKKKIILYKKEGNKWKIAKSKVDGSYLTFESNLNTFKLAFVEKNIDIKLYIGMGSILIMILLIFKRKIKKRAKSKKYKIRPVE